MRNSSRYIGYKYVFYLSRDSKWKTVVKSSWDCRGERVERRFSMVYGRWETTLEGRTRNERGFRRTRVSPARGEFINGENFGRWPSQSSPPPPSLSLSLSLSATWKSGGIKSGRYFHAPRTRNEFWTDMTNWFCLIVSNVTLERVLHNEAERTENSNRVANLSTTTTFLRFFDSRWGKGN